MRTQDIVRTAASFMLATTLAGLTPLAAVAATRTVEAGAGGARVFSPRTSRIARADRIRWEQVSGSHDVTSRLSGYFKSNRNLTVPVNFLSSIERPKPGVSGTDVVPSLRS